MELNNNSESMATIVETFIQEETQELIYDNEKLDKWNDYVKELRLQGQTQIISKEKSPIPFMYLKKGMNNVFETLCPIKVKVEEYNITPIPLEILELIALSKKENYFNEIYICYDEHTPDPVCIGMKGKIVPVDKSYKWYHENKVNNFKEAEEYLNSIGKEGYNKDFGYWTDERYYLLGKWGDVKRSLEELKQIAIKRYNDEKANSYNTEIKRYQRLVDELEEETFNRFN